MGAPLFLLDGRLPWLRDGAMAAVYESGKTGSDMDSRDISQLVLDWHDRQVVVPETGAISLGTAARADLTVPGEFTSRQHAHIERRKQCYVLVDHSTNGTFVQTEDERVTFVRRGEFRLWGNGWIALGEPLDLETAVRFQHT